MDWPFCGNYLIASDVCVCQTFNLPWTWLTFTAHCSWSRSDQISQTTLCLSRARPLLACSARPFWLSCRSTPRLCSLLVCSESVSLSWAPQEFLWHSLSVFSLLSIMFLADPDPPELLRNPECRSLRFSSKDLDLLPFLFMKHMLVRYMSVVIGS